MRTIKKDSELEIISLLGKFSDFDELMEFVAAWDKDFRQIGRGKLHAHLAQVVCDD